MEGRERPDPERPIYFDVANARAGVRGMRSGRWKVIEKGFEGPVGFHRLSHPEDAPPPQ